MKKSTDTAVVQLANLQLCSAIPSPSLCSQFQEWQMREYLEIQLLHYNLWVLSFSYSPVLSYLLPLRRQDLSAQQRC